MAIKTFSADSLVPCGKNETLFSKIEACIWSSDPFLPDPYQMDDKLENV